MAFTTTMTDSAQVDDSQVLAYDQQFIIAAGEAQTMDAFASYKKMIGAKSITLPKYAQLAAVTSALDSDDDVTSVALSDSGIVLTPAEYGNVVTRTSLASLQSGGTVDAAAARLVGMNLAQSKNELAAKALIAGTNLLTPDGDSTEANVASDDLISVSLLNKLYNKMARQSVQRIGDSYVLICHDDVALDIRQLSGWTDVAKYGSAESVLKNEIGYIAGFKVVINNAAALLVADGGATTVDTYRSIALGFNGLGLAESLSPEMRATGPFDKLGRFVNLGWYGCFQYKIVDSDAVWQAATASSVGNNS